MIQGWYRSSPAFCTWLKAALARSLRNLNRQPLIEFLAADAANEIELPGDLVADLLLGLCLGHPVGKELIGILPAMSLSQGNFGKVAEQGRGQRVLTVDGKDYGGVKPPLQAIDHLFVKLAIFLRRCGFHPRSVIDDDLLDLGQESCPLGPRSRC